MNPARTENPSAPASSSGGAGTYVKSTVKSSADDDSTTVSNLCSTGTREVVLLKTAVVWIATNKGKVLARVLFDDGSQRSFVESDFRKSVDLNLVGHDSIKLSGFGASSSTRQTREVVRIPIVGLDGRVYPIEAMVVPRISRPIHNRLPGGVADFPHLHGLQLANPAVSDPAFQVDILVGSDFYYSLVGGGIIRGPGPTAVESKVGYLLSGPTGSGSSFPPEQTVLFVHENEEPDMSNLWTTEGIGVLSDEDADAKFCAKFRTENIAYEDGRPIVKLPFKEDHPPLGSNLYVCQ